MRETVFKINSLDWEKQCKGSRVCRQQYTCISSPSRTQTRPQCRADYKQPANQPPTHPHLTGREINVPFEFLHSSTHFRFPQHLFTHISDNVRHKFVCDARTRFLNQVECISQFINCLHFLWRTYHLVTFTELQREKIKNFYMLLIISNTIKTH